MKVSHKKGQNEMLLAIRRQKLKLRFFALFCPPLVPSPPSPTLRVTHSKAAEEMIYSVSPVALEPSDLSVWKTFSVSGSVLGT